MRTWSLPVLRHFLRLALSAFHVLAAAASSALKSRAALQLENRALRHQLGVVRRQNQITQWNQRIADCSPGALRDVARAAQWTGGAPVTALRPAANLLILQAKGF